MPQDALTAQQAFAEAVNSGNLDAIDETIVAPDSLDHDPAPGQGAGPEGYRAFFGEMRTAFPDLHVEPAHMVTTDDHVCFAYTLTGTHQGPFQGHEPTGNSFTVRGVQIGRFSEGRLVERWGATDEAGIMKQLGLLPS